MKTEKMFDVLGKSMLLAYTNEAFEEIVNYLEKDNDDPGNGGFVGDAIYYLFEHGPDVGIKGMKILVLQLMKNYSHLDYWYDNVINRIESYDWFKEFDETDRNNWNDMKRLADIVRHEPEESSKYKNAIETLEK